MKNRRPRVPTHRFIARKRFSNVIISHCTWIKINYTYNTPRTTRKSENRHWNLINIIRRCNKWSLTRYHIPTPVPAVFIHILSNCYWICWKYFYSEDQNIKMRFINISVKCDCTHTILRFTDYRFLLHNNLKKYSGFRRTQHLASIIYLNINRINQNTRKHDFFFKFVKKLSS